MGKQKANVDSGGLVVGICRQRALKEIVAQICISFLYLLVYIFQVPF